MNNNLPDLPPSSHLSSQISHLPKSPKSPTFLASPGYTGVQNGHVYRSSLYPSALAYHLAYEKETPIHIEAFLNTLNDNVTITVDGKDEIKIHGARGRRSFYQKMDIVGREIDIWFEKSKDKSSFLLKFFTEDSDVAEN